MNINAFPFCEKVLGIVNWVYNGNVLHKHNCWINYKMFPLKSETTKQVVLTAPWKSTAVAHILGRIIYWVTSLHGCHISWRQSHVFIAFLLFFFMLLSNLSNWHGINDTTKNMKIGGTFFQPDFFAMIYEILTNTNDHEILKNGFSHCNRGFLKLQMLFYDFCS